MFSISGAIWRWSSSRAVPAEIVYSRPEVRAGRQAGKQVSSINCHAPLPWSPMPTANGGVVHIRVTITELEWHRRNHWTISPRGLHSCIPSSPPRQSTTTSPQPQQLARPERTGNWYILSFLHSSTLQFQRAEGNKVCVCSSVSVLRNFATQHTASLRKANTTTWIVNLRIVVNKLGWAIFKTIGRPILLVTLKNALDVGGRTTPMVANCNSLPCFSSSWFANMLGHNLIAHLSWQNNVFRYHHSKFSHLEV